MADDAETPRDDVPEPPLEPTSEAGSTEKALARGRAAGTPFVLLGGIALTIWTVVGLVTLALLLLWWLD